MQKHYRQARATPPLDLPDAALVRRVAEGDAAAFEAIMRRYNQTLFRTARGIVASDAEAEDALQEAYLSAWRGIDKFRADARLSTWLVRIVINECLGRLRRKHLSTIPMGTAMNIHDTNMHDAFAEDAAKRPDGAAAREQFRLLIEQHIDRLPEMFRAVFMLRAVEEMTVEEVAEALDIPKATVRTRYFRARRLMRESLASDIDTAVHDAFAFDGERCDRIVGAVLARLSGLTEQGTQ